MFISKKPGYGEVVRPGAYKIDEKNTAIKAITLAGGFTGKATRKHLTPSKTSLNGQSQGGDNTS